MFDRLLGKVIAYIVVNLLREFWRMRLDERGRQVARRMRIDQFEERGGID